MTLRHKGCRLVTWLCRVMPDGSAVVERLAAAEPPGGAWRGGATQRVQDLNQRSLRQAQAVGFLHRCGSMSSPPGQEGTGVVDRLSCEKSPRLSVFLVFSIDHPLIPSCPGGEIALASANDRFQRT